MGRFTDETTGKRLRWLRERKNLKQADLARAIDVNPVYISQMENDHRPPGRRMLRLLATTLGTTVGFLECETDDPTPVSAQPEPEAVYFSPEADKAARLVDAAPPEERARMLAVLQVLAETAKALDGERVIYLPNQPGAAEPLQQRLIFGKHFREQGEGTRA